MANYGYNKEYYLKNRDRFLERSRNAGYSREYYLKNRAKILSNLKIYRDKNKTKVREYNNWYYRSKQKNFSNPHSSKSNFQKVQKVYGTITLNLS